MAPLPELTKNIVFIRSVMVIQLTDPNIYTPMEERKNVYRPVAAPGSRSSRRNSDSLYNSKLCLFSINCDKINVCHAHD